MLNEKQVAKLKEIMNNQYANGPFAGMIFNAYIKEVRERPTEYVDKDLYIKEALDVKLRLEELAK